MQGNAESQKAKITFRKRLYFQWNFDIFWSFSENGAHLGGKSMIVLHGNREIEKPWFAQRFFRSAPPPSATTIKKTGTRLVYKISAARPQLNIALALKLDGGALGIAGHPRFSARSAKCDGAIPHER